MKTRLLGWGTFLVIAIFLPITHLMVKIGDYTATNTIIMVGAEIIFFVFVAVGIVGHEIIQKINEAEVAITLSVLKTGGETIQAADRLIR